MCEEESEDTEAVAKLFEINDSIHRTLQRYRLTKKGDLEGAARIPKGTLGTSGAGVSTGPGNELSLIDFGPEDAQPAAAPAAATSAVINGGVPSGNVEDDLLGLSIQDTPRDAGGAISLGPCTPSFQSSPLANPLTEIIQRRWPRPHKHIRQIADPPPRRLLRAPHPRQTTTSLNPSTSHSQAPPRHYPPSRPPAPPNPPRTHTRTTLSPPSRPQVAKPPPFPHYRTTHRLHRRLRHSRPCVPPPPPPLPAPQIEAVPTTATGPSAPRCRLRRLKLRSRSRRPGQSGLSSVQCARTRAQAATSRCAASCPTIRCSPSASLRSRPPS